MYVDSLEIQNLRCFEQARLDLQYPGKSGEETRFPNVSLLLGDNGVGKTTVLRAIVLAVLGPFLPFSGYVPYHLIRRAPAKPITSASVASRLIQHPEDLATDQAGSVREPVWAELRIRLLGNREVLTIPDDSRSAYRRPAEVFEDDSEALFLVGYGATRWVSDIDNFESPSAQRKRRVPRYQRVAGLFEDHVGLVPLASWLPKLQLEQSERFKEICDLLNRLLPEEARFLGSMENGEYLVENRGIRVPLGALSEGYKAYIGWISDLVYHLAVGTDRKGILRDARGVVLLDEIDLHLHPSWQRRVVPTVARALPNLQFVLTTHSPIVAGTLEAGNIHLLEMDGGVATVRQLAEPIHGLSADQILTSSYFNLDTPRAPDAMNDLRELSKKARSGDSEAALDFMKRLARGTEPFR